MKPRPASKPPQQLGFKKRPLPVEPEPESDEGPSGSEDEEELDADQLRALKRFRSGPGGSDDDDDISDEDDDGDDGSGHRDKADGGGRHRGGEQDEDEDEDEDEEGEDEEDEDEDEDEEDEGSDDDRWGGRTLEEQVADVPFEVLEVLRQDGRGLVGNAARTAAARAEALSFKRVNKDRPQETSSKKPVGRFREVIQVPHKESRDPRFDDTAGAPAKDVFRRRYAFMYNDMLPAEKAELAAKIKKEKNPKFKAKMQGQLQKLDMQLRDEDLRRRTQTLEREWKSKERGAVAGGKTPFFLKAADKKRLELMAKYQELKEHGKLDKFMEKRRKKNASKDHRYLPSGRRQDEQ